MNFIVLAHCKEKPTLFSWSVGSKGNYAMTDTYKNNTIDPIISSVIDKIDIGSINNVIYVPLNDRVYRKFLGDIMNILIHNKYIDSLCTVYIRDNDNVIVNKDDYDFIGTITYDYYERKSTQLFDFLRNCFTIRLNEIFKKV